MNVLTKHKLLILPTAILAVFSIILIFSITAFAADTSVTSETSDTSETETVAAANDSDSLSDLASTIEDQLNTSDDKTVKEEDVTVYKVDPEISEKIGNIIKANEKKLTDTQKNILTACQQTCPTAAGYCARWVINVFSSAGYSITGNADDMWDNYCYFTERKYLLPGMIIAVEHVGDDKDSDAYIYGHVGIYLGSGMVADCHSTSQTGTDSQTGKEVIKKSGSVEVISLSQWLTEYNTNDDVKWGYPASVATAVKWENPLKQQTVTLENTDAGIMISWIEDIYADGYIVYKNGAEIDRIEDTAVNYYLDTEASSGISYEYSIESYRNAVNVVSEALTELSSANKLCRLDTPGNLKAVTIEKGNLVSWDSVKNADGYFIYRRDPSDNTWKHIGTVKVYKGDEDAELSNIKMSIEYLDKDVEDKVVEITENDSAETKLSLTLTAADYEYCVCAFSSLSSSAQSAAVSVERIETVK